MDGQIYFSCIRRSFVSHFLIWYDVATVKGGGGRKRGASNINSRKGSGSIIGIRKKGGKGFRFGIGIGTDRLMECERRKVELVEVGLGC